MGEDKVKAVEGKIGESPPANIQPHKTQLFSFSLITVRATCKLFAPYTEKITGAGLIFSTWHSV